MILKELERSVASASKEGIILPKYDGYSLVNIPHTAMQILGGTVAGRALDKSITEKIDTSGIKKVLLILADGLGYNMLMNSYEKSNLFKAFADKGIIAPLTSGFPPTTAASITTLNTGLTPQEHAIPEWTLYFREVDTIIKPLPLVTIDEKGGPLEPIKRDPKILYSGSTIYEEMAKEGIDSFVIQSTGIINSTYNKLMNRGANFVPYITALDMVLKAGKTVEEAEAGYIYAYTDVVDATTHMYGPESVESSSEIINLGRMLEENLLKKVSGKAASETLVIMTADHGHIQVDPNKIMYLDDDGLLLDSYETGPNGRPIMPAGFTRDVFLHVKKEKEDDIMGYLSGKLVGKAKVLRTKDAVELGLFGRGKVGEKFYDRVGNIMVLPEGNWQAWYSKQWYEDYIRLNKPQLRGMHGGISADELLIPFAAARLSDLQNK